MHARIKPFSMSTPSLNAKIALAILFARNVRSKDSVLVAIKSLILFSMESLTVVSVDQVTIKCRMQS